MQLVVHLHLEGELRLPAGLHVHVLPLDRAARIVVDAAAQIRRALHVRGALGDVVADADVLGRDVAAVRQRHGVGDHIARRHVAAIGRVACHLQQQIRGRRLHSQLNHVRLVLRVHTARESVGKHPLVLQGVHRLGVHRHRKADRLRRARRHGQARPVDAALCAVVVAAVGGRPLHIGRALGQIVAHASRVGVGAAVVAQRQRIGDGAARLHGAARVGIRTRVHIKQRRHRLRLVGRVLERVGLAGRVRARRAGIARVLVGLLVERAIVHVGVRALVDFDRVVDRLRGIGR